MQWVDESKLRIEQQMQQLMTHYKMKLQGIQRQQEALKPTNQIALFRQKFTMIEQRIAETIGKILETKGQRVEGIEKLLAAINPQNVLKKGYTILFSKKKDQIGNR